MGDLKKLQESAKDLHVLYVEDNDALRLNATKLFQKFFENLNIAANGEEALELYKKNRADILITDIKMPRMDGLTLSEKVKSIDPRTRVIIMSAFDDKEFLLRAIRDGVFSYLKKPVNVTELTDTLFKAVEEIRKERENQLFFMHLKSIFNYQSSMVLMMYKNKPTLANQLFLDYFEVETLEEFINEYEDLTYEFLPHDGFLYQHGEINVYDVFENNEQKLFHVKMQNPKAELRHFIAKYQTIPEQKGYAIISFDDVTELNLLRLFDEKQSLQDLREEESKALYNLLEVLQRNNAQIEVHNFYKGLSITNNALINNVSKESLFLKTTYLQLKSLQFEQKTLLVSNALPRHLECSSVKRISFEQQECELQGLHFVRHSAIERKTIRVVPEEKHTVSLFIREGKFHGDVFIEDISLDAIKLNLNAFPAGLEDNEEVILDIVLELDRKPFIINTRASFYYMSESKHSFSLVFLFINTEKTNLLKYITKRQMAIIREFKGLQNG
ncbi:MAG: response regulator [Campylobacterales bacterium]|nr:response regulator [Campylobacterales bacterium]